MIEKVRILLVDDHPLLRRGVLQLISLEDDLEAIGEAADGKEALSLAISLEPDLILLDLNMKGMGGVETLIAMRDADVTCRIVMFTVSDHQADVVSALQNGADGYLLKDMEPDELIEKIRLAAHGNLVLSDKLTELLAMAIRNKKKNIDKPDVESMTTRERQIVKLISEGLTNKQIARNLDITEGTVKVHVKRLFKKLKLRSRVEAAVWVMENRL